VIDAKQNPYDPKLPLAKMSQASGLDRLRWIPDRGLAQSLADLYERTKDPRMQRECEKFELRAAAEQRTKLILVAEASLRGDHGDDARDTASHFFHHSPQGADLPRLQAFLTELQRLNIDVHSMPSRRGGGGRRFREAAE
jgi:hypothetical protein